VYRKKIQGKCLDDNISEGWSFVGMSLECSIHEIGYASTLHFFEAFPHEHYGQLLGRLRNAGIDTSLIALTNLHLNAHYREGTLRLAARDRLVRSLWKNLRNGWATGKHLHTRRLQAFDDWTGWWNLPIWIPLWAEFESRKIDASWLPFHANDEIIISVFETVCKANNTDFPRMTEQQLADYYKSSRRE
jgi:hypothetical protein